jgi:hypothetical protein
MMNIQTISDSQRSGEQKVLAQKKWHLPYMTDLHRAIVVIFRVLPFFIIGKFSFVGESQDIEAFRQCL